MLKNLLHDMRERRNMEDNSFVFFKSFSELQKKIIQPELGKLILERTKQKIAQGVIEMN